MFTISFKIPPLSLFPRVDMTWKHFGCFPPKYRRLVQNLEFFCKLLSFQNFISFILFSMILFLHFRTFYVNLLTLFEYFKAVFLHFTCCGYNNFMKVWGAMWNIFKNLEFYFYTNARRKGEVVLDSTSIGFCFDSKKMKIPTDKNIRDMQKLLNIWKFLLFRTLTVERNNSDKYTNTNTRLGRVINIITYCLLTLPQTPRQKMWMWTQTVWFNIIFG